MSNDRRGLAARVGILFLNLLTPGLGVLRTGPLRGALLLIALLPISVLLLLALFALDRHLSFAVWAVAVIAALVTWLGTFAVATAVSWRNSARRAERPPVWSRWYALVAAFLAVKLLVWPLSEAARAYYKSFYIPSEAMMPALEKDDKLVASMRGPEELARGDVILFRLGDSTYIKRIAALAGDTIALKEGTVFLNGAAVPQRLLGSGNLPDGTPVRRLAERLPGEAGDHEILDAGRTEYDDMAARKIPAGYLFVLGDNRDRSADSRVSRELMGVELLPVSDVYGHALFTWWPRAKMGRRLDD